MMNAKSFLIIALAAIGALTAADYAGWANYTAGNRITCLAEDGGFIWAGTSGGLARINKTTGASRLYFKLNSGLPHNHIRSIAVDQKGVKWIATKLGLARFDGQRWEVYTPANSPLPGEVVSSVVVDGKGVKWINTDMGLALFDDSNWTILNKKNSGVPFMSLTSILFDSVGGAWVITGGWKDEGGLYQFKDKKWTHIELDGLKEWNVGATSAAVSADGHIWVGIYDEGLFKYDGTGWKRVRETRHGPVNDQVRYLTTDRENNVWVSWENNELTMLRGATWTEITFPDLGNYFFYSETNVILFDEEGRQWFGTEHGGLISRGPAGWDKYVTSNTALTSNEFSGMDIDPTGNKWFCSGYHGGVSKFDGTDWTVYIRGASGIFGFIFDIAVDDNGAVYVAAYDTLAKFDGNKWEELPSAARVFIGPDGDLWGSYKNSGLMKFDGKEWITHESVVMFGLNRYYLYDMAWDTNGALWMATSAGLIRIEGRNTINLSVDITGAEPGLVPLTRSAEPLSIAIDAQNVKWLGTDIGLFRYADSTCTLYDSSNSPITHNYISSVEIDSKGDVWLGGWKAGVHKFDGTRWSAFNERNSGLPDNRVTFIFIDPDDAIWIGTQSHGVGVLRENNALTVRKRGELPGRNSLLTRYRSGVVIKHGRRFYKVNGMPFATTNR